MQIATMVPPKPATAKTYLDSAMDQIVAAKVAIDTHQGAAQGIDTLLAQTTADIVRGATLLTDVQATESALTRLAEAAAWVTRAQSAFSRLAAGAAPIDPIYDSPSQLLAQAYVQIEAISRRL